MKFRILLLAAVMFGAICSVTCSARLSGEAAGMPGGWSQAAADDPEVIAAADHAVSKQAAATDEKLELAAVRDAHQQVVAGMNYRLRLAIKRNGKDATATAVIWKKPDRSYQLTEWSWTR